MGDLSTPNSVQKLQTALHAKAKAEAGYRFYALYDKISREDSPLLANLYMRRFVLGWKMLGLERSLGSRT